MQSCKYVKVSGPQKTKLLALKNIYFYKGCTEIKHTDPFLHLAECISITFELQKRDTKKDTITRYRSKDSILCPGKIWEKIIRQISAYPSSSPTMTVNFFLHSDGTPHHFSGQELLNRLRLATNTVGKEKLGFTANQIGLHSARSGAAMVMYLAGVPVFTNMLLGRWSSDAFLHYIRKQVKEFSSGISNKMIQNENFFTISTATADDK
jgi:hypothetical protein